MHQRGGATFFICEIGASTTLRDSVPVTMLQMVVKSIHNTYLFIFVDSLWKISRFYIFSLFYFEY